MRFQAFSVHRGSRITATETNGHRETSMFACLTNVLALLTSNLYVDRRLGAGRIGK